MNRRVKGRPGAGGARGQLSIDVLLAIIAVAIFFTVLVNTYNERLAVQISEQNSTNEAKAILLDAYSAIGAVQAYGLSVDYVSPTPRQKANIDLRCTISKDGQNLTVLVGTAPTVSYTDIDLSEIQFTDLQPPNTAVTTFSCGSAIRVTRLP